MAMELARYGVTVRIVEKAAQRTDKSKALVIWSRTLELLDRTGCTPEFLAAGFRATSARVTAGNREIAHVEFDDVDSPYPFALMLPQSETERLLEEQANRLGVRVERTVELAEFSDAREGVRATLRHADGREEIVEAAWLVGCDGAHSTVRHTLGMEFLGNTLSSDWILADVHLQGVPDPGEIRILWHSEGVLAIFPIGGTRFRVVADVGVCEDGGKRPDPTLGEVQAVLDQRGPGTLVASDPVWLASFRINERKVAEYRAGRVFLAGDAAHIHSPAGGQGMNTGMQDAFNLAWKLALVIRGRAEPSSLLESYSPERSAVGDQVLEGAGRVTMMATLKGGLKQAIRNQIASLVFGLSPVRHALADAMSELSIGYPGSPLSVHGAEIHDGPRAGQRAPIRSDESPVGAGDDPRFVLFADVAPGDADATSVREDYAILVNDKVRPPFVPGGLWLVRPDGYVAVATARGDWGRIRDFLNKLHPVTFEP
jgi:2-polyprenyl-6-methoxyphenol hydroxylase-like FAD-dependent oxidoreductase